MSLHLSGIGSTATPFRQGKILVVPSGSHLPELCVKCGAPCGGMMSVIEVRCCNSWRDCACCAWHSNTFSRSLVPAQADCRVSTYIRCVVHVSAANYSQRTCRNFTLQSERGDIILSLSSPLCPRSSEVPV
jgi:hypothetical protein